MNRLFAIYRSLFAVEKITLAYNLLTCLLLFVFWGEMQNPGEKLLERLAIAIGTFLLVGLYHLLPSRMVVYLRVIFQLALLAYWYPETYEVNRLFPNLDHYFALAEQWLCREQPSVTFQQNFPSKWVSEALNLGYWSYYPMMVTVGTFYFFRRYAQFQWWAFVLMLSFYFYYIIYLFLPVAGPQFYFPAIGWDHVVAGVFPPLGDYFRFHPQLPPALHVQPGFFHTLVEQAQAAGERPTAAFPSSHVGISTVLMCMAIRVSRKLFSALLPFYILLCLATVYIQAHYLIDSVAGFLSGLLFYNLSAVIYRRFVKEERTTVG